MPNPGKSDNRLKEARGYYSIAVLHRTFHDGPISPGEVRGLRIPSYPSLSYSFTAPAPFPAASVHRRPSPPPFTTSHALFALASPPSIPASPPPFTLTGTRGVHLVLPVAPVHHRYHRLSRRLAPSDGEWAE